MLCVVRCLLRVCLFVVVVVAVCCSSCEVRCLFIRESLMVACLFVVSRCCWCCCMLFDVFDCRVLVHVWFVVCSFVSCLVVLVFVVRLSLCVVCCSLYVLVVLPRVICMCCVCCLFAINMCRCSTAL